MASIKMAAGAWMLARTFEETVDNNATVTDSLAKATKMSRSRTGPREQSDEVGNGTADGSRTHQSGLFRSCCGGSYTSLTCSVHPHILHNCRSRPLANAKPAKDA